MNATLRDNKRAAREQACAQAAAMMAGIDLSARCAALGMAGPVADGSLVVRAFGRDLRFTPPGFEAVDVATGRPARMADRLLTLHLLLAGGQKCEGKMPSGRAGGTPAPRPNTGGTPVGRMGETPMPQPMPQPMPRPVPQLITFRDWPGGQFYLEPFRSRSVVPLARQIGNDLDLLRKGLEVFDWQPAAVGDFGARIHCVGLVDVTLAYHMGDDEFGPHADVFFDADLRHVYCTEDVAVLAGRVCLGLLDCCQQCVGCGVCDAG